MKPYPWLRLLRKTDPEMPLEPPIWLGSISNGEYFREQTPRLRRMRQMILERADAGARRLGIDRRQFLASSVGMATTLSVFNLFGCGSSGSAPGGVRGGGSSGAGGSGSAGSGFPGGRSGEGPGGSGSAGGGGSGGGGGGSASGGTGSDGGAIEDGGGYYDVGKDTLDDAEQCAVSLDPSKEFIFDIQTHAVSSRTNIGPYTTYLSSLPNAACGLSPPQACYEMNQYLREIFLNSDTTVAVLSALAATDDQNPLTNPEIAMARDTVNMMAHSQRLVNHCMVLPNYNMQQQLDGMQNIKEMYGVGAWKVYTPWGPNGTGYYLDDAATGIPMIEKARSLGVKLFAAHKGVPLPTFDTTHTSPRDIGPIAKMYPDVNFIVYHSAYEIGRA